MNIQQEEFYETKHIKFYTDLTLNDEPSLFYNYDHTSKIKQNVTKFVRLILFCFLVS